MASLGSPQNNYTVKRSYCENVQKNQPQRYSVAGGIGLLFVSGLHIGWGIWRIDFDKPWNDAITTGILQFILMSWYVFAVIGGLAGAFFVPNKRKKMIYIIAGVILIVSNIMLIALYDWYEAIIIGRCLAGFSHGMIYTAVITHASENAVKEVRGSILSTINCTILFGIFVASTLIAAVQYEYNSTLSSDRIFGIIGLICTVLSIVATIFLTYESVPYLLRRDNESRAIANMLILRNESVMTIELTNELDEMKLMIAQDEKSSKIIFSDGNGSAIGKMIVLRVVSTLTNNFLLNTILTVYTMVILEPTSYHLAPLVLTGTRFGASLIPIISTDLIKRKIHLTASGAISGIILLILAIVIASVYNIWQTSYWVPGALCIAFQIFVSLGVDPMQHLMLSEAFSTSKKAWSIALVTTAENAIQILFIVIYYAGIIDRIRTMVILFVSAGLILVFVLFLQLAIPETFRKTLKETRDLFCQ